MMMSVFLRAAERRKAAEGILADLQLVERWGRFGRPVIVGALAYDLIVDFDIDMEIYCPDLQIDHGFQVLRECAQNSHVTHAQFLNGLKTPDQALYWQIRYRDEENRDWKVDMWSAPEDYSLPRSEHFVEPMKKALTNETRKAILELKESRANDNTLACLSIDLYRAVLEDGVRCADDLRHWLQTHTTGQLTNWKP
jgi:hypothetical protein